MGIIRHPKSYRSCRRKGIALELQVSIQDMWPHVLVMGIKSPAVEDIFRKIAITEMKHTEEIAEKLA